MLEVYLLFSFLAICYLMHRVSIADDRIDVLEENLKWINKP